MSRTTFGVNLCLALVFMADLRNEEHQNHRMQQAKMGLKHFVPELPAKCLSYSQQVMMIAMVKS